jgi:hypothetical protein
MNERRTGVKCRTGVRSCFLRQPRSRRVGTRHRGRHNIHYILC